MPDKPILIFPRATEVEKAKLTPDRRKPPPRPDKEAWGQRLSTRFQELQPDFGVAQATADGLDPEQVIVLETIGSVPAFQNVVRHIAGMEWLGDFDAEIAEPDPGFLADGADPAKMKGRLFVVASNRTAYSEVLRLWNLWKAAPNDKLDKPYGNLAKAFSYLTDVRAWGPQDRVHATGVKEYWEAGLYSNIPVLRFEAEMWWRESEAKRNSDYEELRARVSAAGGNCVKRASISEIHYDGVLIELPAPAVRAVVDDLNASQGNTILRLTGVMRFTPRGQAAILPIGDGAVVAPPNRPIPTGDPVVAILDGLPLTNHAALQGRLLVDDPDGLAGSYQAGENRHGTAMASLVCHGEYNGNEPALATKVYVRPVMRPYGPQDGTRREERFPPDELAVDLVHRAVRRLFDGDGPTPPVAPNVKVINLSLGDEAQPFDSHLSPWARLLDWLAFKYQVLFIVSAGNPGGEITIPAPPASIVGMSDDDLRAHTLRSMAQQRLQRRLLAPAESINALTVGALHAQAGPLRNTGLFIDPMRGAALPSPTMPVASGFRRSVKPEILVPGGRLHLEKPLPASGATSTTLKVSGAAAQPGQLVAACDPSGNSNSKAICLCGSSNAAALTTRRAAQMIERLRELQADPGGEALTERHVAVVLKAMLVHGASWGELESLYYRVFIDPARGRRDWQEVKRDCARFFGYGPVDFDRGTLCTDQRVIVLGCAEIEAGQGHVYNVPLPPALSAQTVRRRLTITLAWFTPINPRHRSYRVADLWFDPPWTQLQVKRADLDDKAPTRGTVQHEVLEGTNAVPITDGDTMPVQVNCRPEAASRINAAIPYALLVSLETAEPLGASIYTQVKNGIDAIRTQVPVQPAASSRART